METVLVVVLSTMLVATAVMSVLAWVGVRRLRRRNRVVPGGAVAPLSWLWSLRAGPRLHRRLCQVTTMTRLRARLLATAPAADLVAELERCAADLDAEIRIVSHAPRGARLRSMPALADEVAHLESLGARMARIGPLGAGALPGPHDTSSGWSTRALDLRPLPAPAGSRALEDRVEALERAWQELSRMT